MEKTNLKEKLVSKGFVFVNQIKKTIGLSKKGSKTTDIEQILEFANESEENFTKVFSAIETLELTRKNRFDNLTKLKNEIKDNWEDFAEHILNSESVPERFKNFIEKLDNIFDWFFGK